MTNHHNGTVIAIALAAILLSTAASADHWTLFREGIDNSPAHTREDDEHVMSVRDPQVRHLDGLQNKVVPRGHTPGDGSLFLDARVAQAFGPYDFYAAHFTEGIHGRPDIILPGYVRISAWYGWWNDMDKDGIILDHHDAADEPTDEFRWRGIASGETLTMLSWWDLERTSIGTSTSLRTGDALQDETARINIHQGWSRSAAHYSQGTITFTHSLLSSVQTLVAAGAPLDVGTGQIDPRHEDALIDVDVYAALSTDVEMLYSSAARAVRQQYGETMQLYAQVYDDIVRGNDLEDTVWPIVLIPFEIYSAGVYAALDGYELASRTISHYDAKEPNHFEDGYEDRAYFGGVGDRLGSYNTYPGYQEDWGFYFDNRPARSVCVGAQGQQSCGQVVETPRTPNADARRTSGTLLGFQGFVILWFDANGDTFVGEVCDPSDPDEFDASRNTCYDSFYNWPHYSGHYLETIGICPHSDVRGGVVTITPQGGGWEGAIVLRDTQATGQFLSRQDWEVHEGTAPIQLRWQDNCFSSHITTRDVIFFPHGNFPHPIRVEATASIPGYVDSTKGIRIGPQSVTDVDILWPRL